ncbi:MAG: ribose-phosphate pyrophosphokinase [Planctomycetes bacterium]|mgnify:CR=1 FL=1|nr:ribose-phosphate pyrophosphokinase [Planctomycetota bacterium]
MSDKSQTEGKEFFTPEGISSRPGQLTESTRGRLLIAGCASGGYLSTKVVRRYQELLKREGSEDDLIEMEELDTRFSDSETCVRVPMHVGGYDVFLIQALLDPTSERSIDQNYMAFLIAARTFREHGANHVTGILPYLAYARQDKPTKFRREPTTAKLMADMTIEAGIDRLICWDPHSGQIHGFYAPTPTSMLSPLTLFIEEFRRFAGREDVIVVAPDVGASKFVTHFGRALNLKCAIASKYRPEPEISEVSEIIGDFEGKTTAILLDDMISGGGTLHTVVTKLVREKGIREVHVGVSHNLCLEPACERLQQLHDQYHLEQVVITNSIPQTPNFLDLSFIKVICLSDPLARTINRIHHNRSVSQVFFIPGDLAGK